MPRAMLLTGSPLKAWGPRRPPASDLQEVPQLTTGTPSAPPKSADRNPGIPVQFLAGAELIPAACNGRTGIRVTIRLTDYRSLPLSCIAGVDISIDGHAANPADLVLILNGEAHRLPELRDRTDLWWFVLDPADLFVPLDAPLAAGPHEVEGTLHLIVPYATVGRSVRSSTSHVRLPLAESGPVWS